MKNLVTNAFIGRTFIDWVRNNYDVIHQHDTFFTLFVKACAKNNVTLYKNDDDVLKSILTKNRKTVTYVEGVDSMVNYLCEDSCHKLHGFNALTDIGFPYIYDEALGSMLMYKYEDYEKNDVPEEVDWLDRFSTYLCPKIMERLVKMTKEYMGNDSVNDYLIQCSWGAENNTTIQKWIASFICITPYESDVDGFIADHLCEDVLHPAMDNVIGEKGLNDDEFEEVRNMVSCETWDVIFKLWSNNENEIKSMRKALGFEKPTKVELCGATWDKVDESPLDETDGVDPIWWHCGTFTDGDLWEENMNGRFCLIRPNGDILVRVF